MVTSTLRRVAVLAVCAGVCASACARGASPAADGPVTLAVPGRASATPWIASEGSRVAVSWGARVPAGGTDVYVAISDDAGRTFGAPVRVNGSPGTARLGGEMAPRVVLTPADASEAAAVEVLWTAVEDGRTSIRLARSVDGRAFDAPRELQRAGAPGDRGWPAVTADAQGVVHALWLDHRGMAASGGAHDHHDAAAGAGEDAADGVAMAQKSGLYYAGAAGERELLMGVCYCCKTAFAAGPDDTLFAAWRHVYPGNIRDIAFTASNDGGQTFMAPLRVSEDEWQLNGCPDDGPAMAVNDAGTVHLVWPTVVSQPEPHKALFYASTRAWPGFTPRVRVSPEGRNIAHPQIALSPSGEVAVFWDELDDGRRQVFVSRKASTAGAFGEPEPLNDSAAASYPVAVFADGQFVVAWTEGGGDDSSISVRRLDAR